MDLSRRKFFGLLGGAAASIIVPPVPKSYFFFGNIFRPKKELNYEFLPGEITPEDIKKWAFVLVGKAILKYEQELDYPVMLLSKNVEA